jgi:hypothetical protein
MAITRLPAWAYSAIAVIPALVFLLIPVQFDPLSRIGLVTAALFWNFAFAFIWWGRLDESGREAHKFAWLYGGGFALVAALLTVGAVHFVPAAGGVVDGIITSWLSKWSAGQGGFALGVLFAAIAQAIGYALVWAGWWLSKRR